MKKLLLSLLCVVGIGAAPVAHATSTTYTFSSNAWAASPANWTSGSNGTKLISGKGVQVSTSTTGANATSPKSFSNVSKIVVEYCTNAKAGKGSIAFTVGGTSVGSVSITAPSSNGDVLRKLTFTPSPIKSGNVKFTVTCTTNSIYINSITIYERAAVGTNLAWSATSQTVALNATSLPTLTNNTGSTATYSSSNQSVATISSAGVITLKGVGTTTLTASTEANDNFFAGSATCTLTVTKASLSSAQFGWSASSANVTLSSPTSALPTLKNTLSLPVTYSSTNPEVATIDESTGAVTLVGPGDTTISAKFAGNDSYNAKTAYYSLNVSSGRALEDDELRWSASAYTAKIGDENTFPTLTNTLDLPVSYTSSDTGVATIDETGAITLEKHGSTIISAVWAGNSEYSDKTVTYRLTVLPSEPIDLAFDEFCWAYSGGNVSSGSMSVTYGYTTSLRFNNPNNVAVTFTSSNTSVATVNSSGQITMLKPGITTLTARHAADDVYNGKSVSIICYVRAEDTINVSALETSNTLNTKYNSFSVSYPNGSGATYTARTKKDAASDNFFLLNTNYAFIQTTVSGGVAQNVYFTFPSPGVTKQERKITVIGSNKPFNYTTETEASSMDLSNVIGTYTYSPGDTEGSIALSGNYEYILIYVSTATGSGGLLNIESIRVRWQPVFASTPQIAVESGEVRKGSQVEVTCPTAGATIYYTTDGTTPTVNSNVYTGPVTIEKACTLKARALKDNYYSPNIASAVYTFDPEITTRPTVTTNGNEITFSCVGAAYVGYAVYYPDTHEYKTSSVIEGSSYTLPINYTWIIEFWGENKDKIPGPKYNRTFVVDNVEGANTIGSVNISAPEVSFKDSEDQLLEAGAKVKDGDVLKIKVPEGHHVRVALLSSNPYTSGSRVATNVDDIIANGEADGDDVALTIPSNEVEYTISKDDLEGKQIIGIKAFDPLTNEASDYHVLQFGEDGTTTGIEDVEAATGDTEAVYYNLQGQRVAHPAQGVFIRVVDGKALKVVL